MNAIVSPNDQPVVPLGPLYLVSVLEKNGFSVDFRDYQLASHGNLLSTESFVSFASDTADILGISCYYSLLPLVLLAVKEIKKNNPTLTVVLGGPGPSSAPERILASFPCVDVVVRGEGERTIAHLLEALTTHKPLSNVRGISYKEGNRTFSNPDQKRIEDLDEIPFPAYDKIAIRDYHVLGIITSRGCPFGCAFCQVSPLWGRHNTRRSIDNVMEEIVMLHQKYGIRRFGMFDDLFTLSRSRVLEFCDRLRKERLDIEWFCLSRVDVVDDELLETISSNGCTAIQFGIESGSDKILALINKGFRREVAENAVRESLKYIKAIEADFIWGFPFETMDDFYETVFFASRLAKMGCLVDFNILTPCTLSGLYHDYGGSIRFDERLCRDVLWKRHPEWDRKHMVELIREHPDIFADFYYYNSDSVFQKYRLLQESGWLFEKLGSLIDSAKRKDEAIPQPEV